MGAILPDATGAMDGGIWADVLVERLRYAVGPNRWFAGFIWRIERGPAADIDPPARHWQGWAAWPADQTDGTGCCILGRARRRVWSQKRRRKRAALAGRLGWLGAGAGWKTDLTDLIRA